MIQLVQTSFACPEQYDVMEHGVRIGFLHLRYGHFTAQVDGPDGETVYEAHTDGDGIFEWDERTTHLNAAVNAIVNHKPKRDTEWEYAYP